MKVLIKNKATYSKEVQHFRKNQFAVLEPGDVLEIQDVVDPSAISYYQSLELSGFDVCFHQDDDSCICEETKVQRKEVDLSKFSDEDLKRIIKSLGVTSRARARWRLESIILENLPRDASPEDYL